MRVRRFFVDISKKYAILGEVFFNYLVMDRFEFLEQIYESISSVEKAVADFREYAIYELDGGISVWIKVKEAVLDNVAKQKAWLRQIRDDSTELTEEQRTIMKTWNLED